MSCPRLLARSGGELGEILNFDQLAGGELVQVFTGGQRAWWDLDAVELIPSRAMRVNCAAMDEEANLPVSCDAGTVDAGLGPGRQADGSERPQAEQQRLVL
jgi:hypothetical protein